MPIPKIEKRESFVPQNPDKVIVLYPKTPEFCTTKPLEIVLYHKITQYQSGFRVMYHKINGFVPQNSAFCTTKLFRVMFCATKLILQIERRVMRKIIRGKGLGKTKALIAMSHETGKRILVVNEERKKNVIRMAEDVDIPTPITLGEFRKTPWFNPVSGILVDDADDVLEALLECKIDAITMRKT